MQVILGVPHALMGEACARVSPVQMGQGLGKEKVVWKSRQALPRGQTLWQSSREL